MKKSNKTRRLTRHPSGPAPDIRHPLMFIPIVFLREGLVDGIVKVGVVTEGSRYGYRGLWWLWWWWLWWLWLPDVD